MTLSLISTSTWRAVVGMIVWYLDLQLSRHSVPFITNVVSLNHAHGEVYSILCDKVCQGHNAGQWFSLGTLVSYTKKIDRRDITEIFMKVAFYTITLTLTLFQHVILIYIENVVLQHTQYSK